jgi:hypothetical protein
LRNILFDNDSFNVKINSKISRVKMRKIGLHVNYQSDVIHGQVVCLQKFSQVDEGEEEEQHERGDEQPTVDQPVAFELVSLEVRKKI